MKKPWLLSPVMILLLGASAQEAAPAGFQLWTPASLKHFESKMHADATADPHHFSVELLADFPHDSAMLVRRESDGPPEWHENQVDVFFVQSGSATLVLGGKLVNGETVGPARKAQWHNRRRHPAQAFRGRRGSHSCRGAASDLVGGLARIQLLCG